MHNKAQTTRDAVELCWRGVRTKSEVVFQFPHSIWAITQSEFPSRTTSNCNWLRIVQQGHNTRDYTNTTIAIRQQGYRMLLNMLNTYLDFATIWNPLSSSQLPSPCCSRPHTQHTTEPHRRSTTWQCWNSSIIVTVRLVLEANPSFSNCSRLTSWPIC